MMLPVFKDFKNTENIWCCSVLQNFVCCCFCSKYSLMLSVLKDFKNTKIFGVAVYCRILFAVVFAVNIL